MVNRRPTGAKTAAARWQVLRQHVESGVPLTIWPQPSRSGNALCNADSPSIERAGSQALDRQHHRSVGGAPTQNLWPTANARPNH